MFRKTTDLQPPHRGPLSDPVVFGVAQGLADLFPPVDHPHAGECREDGPEPDDLDEEEPGMRFGP